ncbi:zinc knuckle (CCHC-type) family protein [Thalictrum thalictroides]|uniref:Zinc knuckle (CCHC-type) family protein n=1 Tax=Thalictrum thalictroides TaxID=46969 RepID=A0A7J6VFC5_THATH|nr:zinc knuckle (CCHC-type) family protein [Thalictrum thalictroides]
MQSKSRKEVNQASESILMEKIKELQPSNSPNMRFEAKGLKQGSTNILITSQMERHMENTSKDVVQCKELVMNNVEDTLEELELAFKKKWIQSRSRTEIDLTRVKEVDEEKWSRTLVGKLQTKRWFEVEDVKKELIRNWGFRSKFEFAMLAEGIFTITFKKEIDYVFVLENGPWLIHGYVISFKKWSKDLNLEEFDFSFFPMWIQVFGLPLERFGAANLWKVGSIFGKVLAVDPVGGADDKVPYGRVQVMYNVQEPVKKDGEVTLSEGKKSLVSFRYERLPLFCYFCGLIGHDYGVCKDFKECLKIFGRELSRDESKKVMNFSYFQKAKSYKFGAGIQTRHTSAVDTESEINFEDRKFKEWKEEKQEEEERRKKELTQVTISQNILTTEGFLDITKENGILSNGAASQPGQGETEARMGGFKCGDKALEDANQTANMEGNKEGNTEGLETEMAKFKEGELSEVRSMEISPYMKEKIKDVEVQSVTMMDISHGSKPRREQGGNNGWNSSEGPSCKKALFQKPIAILVAESPSLYQTQSETLQTLQNDPAHQTLVEAHTLSQLSPKNQNPQPGCPNLLSQKSDSTSHLANTITLVDQNLSKPNLGNQIKSDLLSPNNPMPFPTIPEPVLESNLEKEVTEKSKKRDRTAELGEEEEDSVRKKLKMAMVFSCDAERGKMEMKEEDKLLVTQGRIDEVVRIMKLYKNGGSPSKEEKKFVKDETTWLQEKNFNFGLGLLADGVQFRKECDEGYAKYLITYGIPEEEEEMKSKAQREEGDITTAQSSTESGSSTARTIKKRKSNKMEKRGFAVVPKKPPAPRC